MEVLIAQRYAKALTSSVDDVNQALRVLEILSDAMSHDKASHIFSSPLINASEKTALIVHALEGKVDKRIENFVKLLGEHGRLELIPEIVHVLRSDMQQKENRYEGVLESASEVPSEKVAMLETALSRYSGAEVKLRPQQNDIDGLRVRVEDLGLEVNFSKERVKTQLIDYIKQSL